MEENKELETVTEKQATVTSGANNGEKKGLFEAMDIGVIWLERALAS